MSRYLILSLSLLVPACDAVEEPVQFRSEPSPGCSYEIEFNWNDDFQNPPHHCAAKLALCADQQVQTSCDQSKDDCWEKLTHCWSSFEACWKSSYL